jgi:hypothetical protein
MLFVQDESCYVFSRCNIQMQVNCCYLISSLVFFPYRFSGFELIVD